MPLQPHQAVSPLLQYWQQVVAYLLFHHPGLHDLAIDLPQLQVYQSEDVPVAHKPWSPGLRG